MTLLAIAREMAVNLAESAPSTVQGDDPFSRVAVQFINETGRELARRVDWNVLRRVFTVNGDGLSATFTLPEDFARVIQGAAALFSGVPLRGSLSSDEWASLQAGSFGVPRYFYLSGQDVSFYPGPEASQTVEVAYLTAYWAEGADTAGKPSMSLDSDVERLPSDLLVRGAVWRWLRHSGRDFADHMSEYEAALADLVKAGNGVRQP